MTNTQEGRDVDGTSTSEVAEMRAFLDYALEVIDEVAQQMDPPPTATELVQMMLNGDRVAVGDEQTAIEIATIAGRIDGMALAQGKMAAQLLAEYGFLENWPPAC